MPFVVYTMFWFGISMPIGAVFFVCFRLLAGDDAELTLYGQEVTSRELFVASGAIPLTVAAVGVALAYGIWSKREYPRYLSMIVLGSGALWANIRMFQTSSLSWEPIVLAIFAVSSIRYLVSNPDVKEYYHGAATRDVAHAEVLANAERGLDRSRPGLDR